MYTAKLNIKGLCLVIVSFFLLVSLNACGEPTSSSSEKPIVNVSISPMRYFAEQLGGDYFEVKCIIPEGMSPDTYAPTPRQMVNIGKGVAYLRTGSIGFEKAWMDRIQQNNPALKVFNLSNGAQAISSSNTATEEDPHLWMSIEGMKLMVKNMTDAFKILDPKHKAVFDKNYQSTIQRIDTLAEWMSQIMLTTTSKDFIIYHPALTYFAQENGLHQICISEEAKEPTAAQLRALVQLTKAKQVSVIFIQKEFDQENARTISEETGCRLVVIDPLGYDWFKTMKTVTEAFIPTKK